MLNMLKHFMSTTILAGMVSLATMTAHPSNGWAFADTTNKTEAYTILPNQTAFWVPDVGANEDNQAKFDSEAYLTANRLAVKRYIIPHEKLGGSGGGWATWDYYVSTGRLLIVNRAAFSREWVTDPKRGTGPIDEGFHCQSREGLNITGGISIVVSINPDNAAKYLYRFGVKTDPKADPTALETIFQSVYYARDLSDVMDDIGRKALGNLTCHEISARSFDDDNFQANQIMDTIKKEFEVYLSSVGITLESIGWADTFTFDPEIQKVVNDVYKVRALGNSTQVLQALALVQVEEGMGRGLENHGFPMVFSPDMVKALLSVIPSGNVVPGNMLSPNVPAIKN
jgi:SPFH domain / Band 7 family